jgi:hypothetical protein
MTGVPVEHDRCAFSVIQEIRELAKYFVSGTEQQGYVD